MNGIQNFRPGDDEYWPDLYHEWHQHRDKVILEALKAEGFCMACLPPVGTPANAQPDFTMFLPSLDGSPNLVVAAPHLTLEIVERTIRELPQRQFADGTTIQVIDDFESNFCPSAEDWFRFQTEIVYIAGVVPDPPFAQGGLERGQWAHCVKLKIRSAGTEFLLRVIHLSLGPGPDAVLLHFLTPHGLVPRKILL
jgi:hypothetical protein